MRHLRVLSVGKERRGPAMAQDIGTLTGLAKLFAANSKKGRLAAGDSVEKG